MGWIGDWGALPVKVILKFTGEDKMITLNPKVKEALENINFIQRYQNLSNIYNDIKTPTNERLRYIDGEIIMDNINELGYNVEFEPKEKYFKIQEINHGNYVFGCHIILFNGMVDLVWIVREKDSLLLGLPLSEYSRLIIDPQYRIKKPIFGTYEDLGEILRVNFDMFEDFKRVFGLIGYKISY